jgi:hypothetical protein
MRATREGQNDEVRNQKSERNPNFQTRKAARDPCGASDFVLRTSFWFRISSFGF